LAYDVTQLASNPTEDYTCNENAKDYVKENYGDKNAMFKPI
jgi:hypothetical protein